MIYLEVFIQRGSKLVQDPVYNIIYMKSKNSL